LQLQDRIDEAVLIFNTVDLAELQKDGNDAAL
jgi:hypothetical protein